MNRKEKRALKRQKKAVKFIELMDKFANFAGFDSFESLAYGFKLASPEDIAAVSSLRPVPKDEATSHTDEEDPEELLREEYSEWQ